MIADRTFRADIRVWRRVTLVFSIVISVFILAACVGGQIRFGRFPAWFDLCVCGAVPILLFGMLYGAGRLFVRFCPVTVSASGLRCANYWGFIRTVRWERFVSASAESMFGLSYISCRVRGMLWGPMIPLWTNDLDGLKKAVVAYAGSQHPVALVLGSVITMNQTAEPGATDNPDGAQRLREDH